MYLWISHTLDFWLQFCEKKSAAYTWRLTVFQLLSSLMSCHYHFHSYLKLQPLKQQLHFLYALVKVHLTGRAVLFGVEILSTNIMCKNCLMPHQLQLKEEIENRSAKHTCVGLDLLLFHSVRALVLNISIRELKYYQ